MDVYVADKVFSVLPVTNRSDVYFTYSRSDFLRNEMAKRAPGQESAGSGFNVDHTGTYSADVWALHKDVDQQVEANQDAPLSLQRDTAVYLTQQALQRRDIQWASSFFTTGVWTGGTNAGDMTGTSSTSDSSHFIQWDQGASTPIQDIRKQIISMAKTGFRPNVLCLGPEVYQILVDHPQFTDRVKAGQTPGGPAIVNEQAIASVLGLDRVVVAWTPQNTAVEGQSASNAFVFGKHALLAHSAPPSIMRPTAGLIFSWTGYSGATAFGHRIKSFPMLWLDSIRVEVDLAFDCRSVATDLGVFFSGAVS
jgi:hypothetical protein